MDEFLIGGKTISVFSASVPGAPVIYLNTVSGEGRQVFDALQAAGSPAVTLVAISHLNWNHDMAPWDCPAVFRTGVPCTGGADEYLKCLVGEILPTVEQTLPEPPGWRGIAGYSLAGLFAIYALYQTDCFSRAASMSGSFWFPGIMEYIRTHTPERQPDYVYFSLGDREDKTRNSLLKTVRENTETLSHFYRGEGINTNFQLQPGNHYRQAVERTAAGIAWLLQFR